MSDWNLGRIFRVAVSAVVSYYTNDWRYFLAQVAREGGNAEAGRKNRRALERYNSSLQNRLEMVDLQPGAARTLVLGRVRYVEGVRRRWTSGDLQERLTMIVSFAGHEIDGFEEWYLDDSLVTIDAAGYVTSAPYASTVLEPVAATGTLDGSGNGSVNLPGYYSGGVAPYAVWSTGSGDSLTQGTAAVSMAGTVATISGGQAGANFSVGYEKQVTTSHVRIRPFSGADGQNIGAAIAAEYPGKITATDRFAGIACAVVDVWYSPDVFPQGRPNVTAVFRGAKCLDPRTGLVAWTQNPALQALHYATWAHGWKLQPGDYMAADAAAAATVCDVSTAFTLRDAAGVASTVTLPRYRCDIAIGSDVDHEQAMSSIMQTMAGRSAWAGGVWRMRAGVMGAPVATITQAWLVNETRGGRPDDAPVISVVQSIPRVQRINRVSGSCVDPAQRYQVLPFPAVQDAVRIARDGERLVEVELAGVSHIAHAQHLSSIAIRQAHAGLQVELLCGLDAEDLELLDVVALDMPRYGFSGKTFEVVGWKWAQVGAYKVQLSEITAALFEPLAELTGRDPAPDSDLRAPWDVPALGAIVVESGTAQLTDGSTITRTSIAWAAVEAASVRSGGQVEVQYAQVGPSDPQWATWAEPGDSTRATIPGLLAGRHYIFRARAVQSMPLVRGAWSPAVVHKIAEPPAVTLPGLGLNTYRVVAAGLTAVNAGNVPASTGLYQNGVKAYDASRSYRVAAIRRSDGLLTFEGAFDVYGDPAASEAMATALNSLGPTHIVIVWTHDEPKNGRVGNGLDLAMYRCGASRAVYGSPRFAGGAAYVLVGIAGCGEGNGAEAYQGSIDNDPYAWCDLSFGVVGGLLTGVSGTYTPRSLADYLYVGDLDATKGATFGVNVNGLAQSSNIAPGAATSVFVDADAAVSVDGVTGSPYGSITIVNALVFTPDASGDALVTVSGGGFHIAGALAPGSPDKAYATCRCAFHVNGVRSGPARHLDTYTAVGERRDFAVSASRRFAVTAGVQYTVEFSAQKFEPLSTLEVSTEMRVEVVKR